MRPNSPPHQTNVSSSSPRFFKSASRPATGLSVARRYLAGAANSGTAAYFAGGLSLVPTVDKFAFSDDGRTTLGTGLSLTRYNLAAAANSGTL